MNFLLTNDDGIHAPGLAALQEVVSTLGDFITVAPHEHLSGCSHRVDTGSPLLAESVADNRYSLTSTPADCARIGLTHLAKDTDWVLSGINDGGNLGADVNMSGTVAAVREGTLLGKPGIAFSQYRKSRSDFPWDALIPVARRILLTLLETPLHAGAFWNVNFPDVGREALTQWAEADQIPLIYCELDPHPLPALYEAHEDGYIYRGVYGERDRVSGRDIDVCFSGGIAVTQILPPRSLSAEEIETLRRDASSS
ncbi:5'/3'-nucleotidase SurE [Thalassoroseus pseudoceratinae]|uniref:5'/3'-nucleotidase SurE n=1 Tax=Thalassoroseus pseudoceratinae TaxID=2713176 RepID=UPI0014211019|nr:5'/3'-nucleotidase SurE [Thalassoroseus pseudoceratinae]